MNIRSFLIRKPSRLVAAMTLASAGLLLAGTGLAAQTSTQAAPVSHGMSMQSNRFGGPVYDGPPALDVTVALVIAGGGPDHFSLVTALNSMLGEKTVKVKVAKLTKQYGTKRVNAWVEVMNFYVADTLKIVKAKGIKLPPPAKLSGVQLATTLVKVGTDKQGVFWAGLLFDHAVSHAIHNQLMDDADAKYGAQWDANAHAVTNQAFYDVAQALGDTSVKLSPYHK
ncbi:MAG: hypothetical protein ACRES7_04180 [Gammaproteobacteria bacterium]